MVTPPHVAKAVFDSIEGRRPSDAQYPPANVIRILEDALNLQEYYGGEVVAGFRSAPGYFVVLAVSYRDVRELFGKLTANERAEVVLVHPQPFTSDESFPRAQRH